VFHQISGVKIDSRVVQPLIQFEEEAHFLINLVYRCDELVRSRTSIQEFYLYRTFAKKRSYTVTICVAHIERYYDAITICSLAEAYR
jgi:hypothetical protein